MKKIFLILCLMISTQAIAQSGASDSSLQANSRDGRVPSLFRPDPVSFNARLGVGSAFSPQTLWFSGSLEAQLDKFVALGPIVQFGQDSTTDYIMASMGPRFTIPFSYFEFGVNGGFGFSYRNVAGFEFTNFLYEAGLNLDFYIVKNLSLGVGYNINIISSSAQLFMSALVGSITGHF